MEATIRALWDAGNLPAAATEAIETYGPEVLGWLTTSTGDASEADEAFGTACEDLWRGLAQFRWECSVRAWLYTLARHALIRGRKRAAERPARRQPLESVDVADRARSRTAPWLRTEVKDVFARLREELSEEERELLVLRVDRNLAWDEIAIILGGGETSAAAMSARLRKRFQSIKGKLRERARDEGILGEDS
ncbi:MAG: sigma-70 family RNA polymerase sigma factor [Labilithrix sp.]|nr:sigma-70 family RNA polymerase sigma factor [Labilithrix sp.]